VIGSTEEPEKRLTSFVVVVACEKRIA
jgi:hypothetical protein